MKTRPMGITLLAVLALIAGAFAVIHTLQMLHLFPIRGPLGVFHFFTFDLIGALLWGVTAAMYLWVAKMLWDVNPQGWLFLVFLSSFNLILAVISIIGASSWQAMLPSLVTNGLVLLYCLLPNTKASFAAY